MRVLQGLQTVDCAFVGLVAVEGKVLSTSSDCCNTNGSIVFLTRRSGYHLWTSVRSCPHEKHALKMLSLDRSIWGMFCNVAWGMFEQLRDLFHIFAWAIVRCDAPRVLVRRGQMRFYSSLFHYCASRNTVHHKQCQRRWEGPPSTRCPGRQPGARNRDPPTGR